MEQRSNNPQKAINFPSSVSPRVASLLSSQVVSNVPVHAHLFYGQPGIGKRSTAAFFTQAIMCSNLETAPCFKCSNCLSLLADSHPDYQHVSRDPATSAILIEQIRQVNRFVNLSKFQSSRKVVVLEDAQDMNLSAANSLLKTLEEPPDNVILIIVADNINTLPRTIISRCQMIKFNPASKERLESHLDSLNASAAERDLLTRKLFGRIEDAVEAIKADKFDRYKKNIASAIKFLMGDLRNQILDVQSTVGEIKESSDVSKTRLIANAIEEKFSYIEIILRDLLLVKYAPALTLHANSEKELSKLGQDISTYKITSLIQAIASLRRRAKRNANLHLYSEYILLMNAYE